MMLGKRISTEELDHRTENNFATLVRIGESGIIYSYGDNHMTSFNTAARAANSRQAEECRSIGLPLPSSGLLDQGMPPEGQTSSGQWQQPLPPQSLQGIPERELILLKRTWVDGVSTNEYECLICGRRFRWRSCISVHTRTHTGRKPYECRICRQRFSDSSTRKKHERKAHGCRFPSKMKADHVVDVVEVPTLGKLHFDDHWQCRFCFVLLETEDELNDHLRQFHNQTVPSFHEAFRRLPEMAPGVVELSEADHLLGGIPLPPVDVQEGGCYTAELMLQGLPLPPLENGGMETGHQPGIQLPELDSGASFGHDEEACYFTGQQQLDFLW